jgi:hypothetical protein
MRFRFHRGSLESSLETTIELEGRTALIEYLRQYIDFNEANLMITPYGGDDYRIGWTDVHMVSIPGYGVIGFCEGS